MKQLFLVSALSLCAFFADAFPKDWNGVKPCISTRADAERLLGKDKLPLNVGIYDYEDFRVHVLYRQIEKSFSDNDIVERIDLYPNKRIFLDRYVRKIPNFREQVLKTALDDDTTHVRGLAVYRNWKEGFEIWVQKDHKDREIVYKFGYFDPAWDCSKRLPSQSKDSWTELKPLVSTREEVEQVIGKPVKYFPSYGLYKSTADLEFSAWYSDGKCGSNKPGIFYDVGPGILTRLYVALKTPRSLSSFQPDLKKLKRVQAGKMTEEVYYYSLDESIVYKTSIEANGTEWVRSISVQPGKDNEKHRCKNK